MGHFVKLLKRVGLAAVLGLALAQPAAAVPFTITSVLTGDARPDNPDNLIVVVTITGDTTSNQTNWVIDLNSLAHPDAKLGVFSFNLLTGAGQTVSFSNFSPSGWSITTPADNVPGSGGADFRFESTDPAGPSNNVTNSVLLSFTATLSSGTWSDANFLNAPLSTGGGIPDPGAQMGAHLQSLSTAGCTGCSDSGFASGSYGDIPQGVPEPSTLLLSSLGVAIFGLRRRRRA